MTAASPKTDSSFDPLRDARTLEAHVERLRVLLEMQKRQIETLNDRLYSPQPAGIAARRLLDLKRRSGRSG